MAAKGTSAEPTPSKDAVDKSSTRKTKAKKAAPPVETPVEVIASVEVPAETVPVKKKRKKKRHKKKDLSLGRAQLPGQPGKNGRHKKAKRPTLAEKLQILERQDLVYQLIKAGNSYSKISAHLRANNLPSSKGTIHNDLVAYLDRDENKRKLNAEQYLQIELDHLDEIRSTHFLEMKITKDPEHAGVLLRVSRERDRLLQFSKAQQSDTAAKLALASLLGVDPEELPDGDSSNK